METKTVKLYSLDYNNVKTYLAASLFILGNLALPQLFHLIPQGGITWLPIYFFTLVGAYKFGWMPLWRRFAVVGKLVHTSTVCRLASRTMSGHHSSTAFIGRNTPLCGITEIRFALKACLLKAIFQQ